ncbi:MAG: GNAT family N-acetyltransferase [Sphingobacteriales bacterium]|nr:GNAT family N-acetyltransferase [Sphingobacteriales bacterium]
MIIRSATADDIRYATAITAEMESSAKARGTGIAKRSADYVSKKILEQKAVIAVTTDGHWVGFCYIEAWGHDSFVANSGLIVAPQYRKSGIAKAIKQKIFQLSREKYPAAKIFGLTTGLAVMKINSDLGYEPVTYSELTDDEDFWAGCKSCVNYDILVSKERKNCMCTAMLYDPTDHYEPEETASEFKKQSKIYERFMRLKQGRLIKFLNRNKSAAKGKTSLFGLLNF